MCIREVSDDTAKLSPLFSNESNYLSMTKFGTLPTINYYQYPLESFLYLIRFQANKLSYNIP